MGCARSNYLPYDNFFFRNSHYTYMGKLNYRIIMKFSIWEAAVVKHFRQYMGIRLVRLRKTRKHLVAH
jgi:hypothetical protein